MSRDDSGDSARPLEAVEDQVEPELELTLALVARRRDVLLGVLGEVWVAAGSHLADETGCEVCKIFPVTEACRGGGARALGADHVVDYTREDFTRSGRRYDVLFDVAGSRSWRACKRVLEPEGILVMAGAPKGNRVIAPLGHIARVRLASLPSSQKCIFFVANLNKADLGVLRELIEAGKVTPVLERRYELSEVPDALAYMGEGHARGKIVITVSGV